MTNGEDVENRVQWYGTDCSGHKKQVLSLEEEKINKLLYKAS